MAGHSQSFQCSLQIVRKFPLRRYAAYVPNEKEGPPSDKGTWKVIVSTTNDPLFLYITDTDMMVVNQGSISHGNNERRFRVEFDRFADKTGVEQCQLCTDLLSQYFPFHERSEIAATRNTGINSTDFFKQQFESPEVLREIVKSCLQDPSFPNFVKQVDDTLQSLLSKP
ncbi:uncharacterized protein LOC142579534 isoform X2 [Dermacentor variabilis]|uniref:uncharacterized protein LOC142579534 isoform X2 n=1 Tax=Dermacentor variabilis TaxID=34621 RepID=UPI0021554898